MHKGRLEAFSDGVIAILITIMVLELKPPHGDGLLALKPLIPIYLSYVLSFIYIAIYWTNHHHLFQITKHVNGAVLWANIHLLFWLSLIPFVTAWSGENQFAAAPVALYGAVLFMAAMAYFILVRVLITLHGKQSDLARAIGRDIKGKISAVIYALAIPLTVVSPYLSLTLYVVVALMWIIPDRRVEKLIGRSN